MNPTPARSLAPARAHPWLIVFGILAGLGALSAASAAWWYHYNFHASLTPVQLSATEAQTLDQKVGALKGAEAPPAPASDPLKTFVLSEREINGYLEEQGLGDQIKVGMRHGQIAATAILPVDADVPVLGGHNVRLTIVLNTKLNEKHHLALSLAEVNVGGISLPNAWLGGIKGLNLLDENQQEDMFKGFAAGIKDFQVQDGEVRVVLND